MTPNPNGPHPSPPWGQPGVPRTGVPAAVPPHGYQGSYGQQPPPQQAPQQPPRPPIRPTKPQPPGQQVAPPTPPRPGTQRPPRRRRSAVPWIFGSLFAVIGIGAVLLLGFVAPGWFVRTVFDAEAVQKGVQQVLRGSYKLGAVESVRCPREVPVEPSRTFECEVKLGASQQRTVTVTIKDSQGVYAVGYPK